MVWRCLVYALRMCQHGCDLCLVIGAWCVVRGCVFPRVRRASAVSTSMQVVKRGLEEQRAREAHQRLIEERMRAAEALAVRAAQQQIFKIATAHGEPWPP